MIRFLLIIIGAIFIVRFPVVHADEESNQQNNEPETYQKCVQAASERNTKWTQYRVDVNNCRAEFGIQGEY